MSTMDLRPFDDYGYILRLLPGRLALATDSDMENAILDEARRDPRVREEIAGLEENILALARAMARSVAAEKAATVAEEAAMLAEEEVRVAEEEAKVTKEGESPAVEKVGVAEEKARVAEEESRVAEEESRVVEDFEKVIEAGRKWQRADEEARVADEKSRVADEKARVAEEVARPFVEKARAGEEELTVDALMVRIVASEARLAAEKAVTAAEKAGSAAAKARIAAAETGTAAAEARLAAEKARTVAIRLGIAALRVAEARTAATEARTAATEARTAVSEARNALFDAMRAVDSRSCPRLVEEGFFPLGSLSDVPYSPKANDSAPKPNRGFLKRCAFDASVFVQTDVVSPSKGWIADSHVMRHELSFTLSLVLRSLLECVNLKPFDVGYDQSRELLEFLGGGACDDPAQTSYYEAVRDPRHDWQSAPGYLFHFNDRPLACVEVKYPRSRNPVAALQDSRVLRKVSDYMKVVYLLSGVEAQFAILTDYKVMIFLWTEEANELAGAELAFTRKRLESWVSAAARLHPKTLLDVYPEIMTPRPDEPKLEAGGPARPSCDVKEALSRFDVGNLYVSEPYYMEGKPDSVSMLYSVLFKAMLGFLSPNVVFEDGGQYDLQPVNDEPSDVSSAPLGRAMSDRQFLQLSTVRPPRMQWAPTPDASDYANLMDPQTTDFNILKLFRAGADGRAALAFSKGEDGRTTICVLKMMRNGRYAAAVEVERWNHLYSDVWPRTNPAFAVNLMGLGDEKTIAAVALPYVGLVNYETTWKMPEFREALDAAIEDMARKGFLHDDLCSRHVGYVYRNKVMRVVLIDLTRMKEVDSEDESKVAEAICDMREQLSLK